MSENNNNTAAGEKGKELFRDSRSLLKHKKIPYIFIGRPYFRRRRFLCYGNNNKPQHYNFPAYCAVLYKRHNKISEAQITPIVDIRLRMGKPEYENPRGSNCIIVLNINSVMLGILVDTVQQMLDIATQAAFPRLP